MAKGLVSDTNLTAIANAIRTKNGSSDRYTPATMATAIANIPTSQVDQESALQWMLNNKTDYTGVASGLTTLTNLPTFTQTAGRKSLYRAFYNCQNLESIAGLDTQNVTIDSIQEAFYNCQKITTIPDIRSTSSASAKMAFYNCYALTASPKFRYGQSEAFLSTLRFFNDVSYMFYNCRALTTVTFSLSATGASGNHPAFTSMYNMFRGCTSLTSATFTSNSMTGVTDLSSMFWGCTSLTSVSFTLSYPAHQKDNKTAANSFRQCSSLETIPDATLDIFVVPGVTTTLQNFAYQSGLRSINLGNRTSAVTNFRDAFDSCPNLTDVGTMDMSSVSGNGIWDAFLDSPSLSNQSLDNIMASLLTATKLTSNKTLQYVGLSSAQATTCTTLSNWAALSAAGWTTGY